MQPGVSADQFYLINEQHPSCITRSHEQTRDELEDRFKEWAEPAYRVGQVLRWLYVHRVADWEAMTNLPKSLREKLSRNYSLHTLELVRKQGSRDTTLKFLWRLADHSLVESVLIPSRLRVSAGGSSNRYGEAWMLAWRGCSRSGW